MAQSALLAAVLALPEDTPLNEFLDSLGYKADFCSLVDEDDAISEATENGVSAEEIGRLYDIRQYVPAGFRYLLTYDTEDGPVLLSVKPKTEAAWWLRSRVGDPENYLWT